MYKVLSCDCFFSWAQNFNCGHNGEDEGTQESDVTQQGTNSSKWVFSTLSTGIPAVEESSDEEDETEDGSWNWINDSSNGKQGENWANLFNKVVVSSLSVVEMNPVVVWEFLCVATSAHVRVALSVDWFFEVLEMEVSEVRFHVLLVENFSSCSSSDNKTDDKAFEGDEAEGNKKVAVVWGEGQD